MTTPAQSSARPALGIAMTIVASGLMTANDAAMKALVVDMPVGQAVALRGLWGLVLLLGYAVLTRRTSRLRPKNARNVLILSVLILGNLFLFPASLQFIPLADAIMLAYLSPVVVAALSPWLLRESVGWRRWSAVALGLVGAWLVIDPGGGALHPAVIMPLIVAATLGVRDILTRRYIHGESVLALSVVTNFGAFALGLLSVPGGWVGLDATSLALIVTAGTLFTGAQIMMAAAFRYAEAPVLSCLKYSAIAYAAALGWLIWGETLGVQAWFGAALIAVSGVVISLRTRTPQKQRTPA